MSKTSSQKSNRFFRNSYQQDLATHPCSGRFIGAINAFGPGASLILGDPLKEAACTADSIFNLCDDTRSLSNGVEDIFQMQKERIATLQCVQSANDEKFFLLGNEMRATQNERKLSDAVNDHLQVLDDRLNGIQADLVLHKESERKLAHHSLPQSPRH